MGHDLLPVELHKLKEDLRFYSNIGHLVTFNNVIKDWVVWGWYAHVSSLMVFKLFTLLSNRPHHALKIKPGVPMPIAASGFHNLPNFVAPLCPHVYNNWCTTKECRMECYRETVSGKEHWVFCAHKHQCQF